MNILLHPDIAFLKSNDSFRPICLPLVRSHNTSNTSNNQVHETTTVGAAKLVFSLIIPCFE